MPAVEQRPRGQSRSPRVDRGFHLLLCACLIQCACLLLGSVDLPTASAQTLARPGWAGSGMTVERWWPHAVLCEVDPDSLAAAAPNAADGSTLHRLALRLEDLQTLGVDAVLLRGLEAESAAGSAAGIDPRYGTLDEFDQLTGDAVRHGLRIIVELRPGIHGTPLTNTARLWLNHGVTGLAIASDDPADLRLLRGVLHGYVGERVLIGQTSAPPAALRTPGGANGSVPDLAMVRLPPVMRGAAEMRSAIQGARAMLNGRGPVPLLSASADPAGDPAPARVLATALLGSGGAVLLRADDLDLAHASDPSSSTIFAWYRQWSGLHRGNATMRSGEDLLLDHDADGALVWVREGRGGSAPILAICNTTGKPIRFSLVEDIQKLRLRGSFLRTVARSDGGMGAMPLREVSLPPFAVFVGELSR